MDVYVAREDPEPGVDRRAGRRRRPAARRARRLRAVLVRDRRPPRRAGPARRPGAHPRRRRRDAARARGARPARRVARRRCRRDEPMRRPTPGSTADGRTTVTTTQETVTVAGRRSCVGAGASDCGGWPVLCAARAGRLLVGTGVWLLLFSSVLTVRDVSVTGTARPSARSASSRSPRRRSATPLARVDLDADPRAGSRRCPRCKSVDVSRVVAAHGRDRGHRAHRRSRSSTAAPGCQASTTTACCSAATPREPDGLPVIGDRPDADVRRAARGRPRGRRAAAATLRPGRARRGATRSTRSGWGCAAVARVMWGSAEDSAPEGRGARRAPERRSPRDRRLGARPADHRAEPGRLSDRTVVTSPGVSAGGSAQAPRAYLVLQPRG